MSLDFIRLSMRELIQFNKIQSFQRREYNGYFHYSKEFKIHQRAIQG
jgi:hypothetical protein